MRLLPLAVLAYLLIALAWPTWRTWRRARVFPVVFHREAETAQRVIGLLLGLLLAGLAVWSLLCAVMEPGRLGIWQLGPGWQALGWGLFFGGLVLIVVLVLLAFVPKPQTERLEWDRHTVGQNVGTWGKARAGDEAHGRATTNAIEQDVSGGVGLGIGVHAQRIRWRCSLA